MTSEQWRRRGVLIVVLVVGWWAALAQAQVVIGGPFSTDWYEQWYLPVPGLRWFTPPPAPNIFLYGYGVPPVYVPPAPGLVPQVTPYAYPSPYYWPQPFSYGYQPPVYQYDPFPYGYQPSWPYPYQWRNYPYWRRYWRGGGGAGQQGTTGQPARQGSVRPVPYLQGDSDLPAA